MANNPEMTFTSPKEPGSSIISVHTERRIKIYAVHESELNALSYLNTASIGLFGLGAFFAPYFIDNLVEPEPEYIWWSDPFGWTALALFVAALVLNFVGKGIMNKIKQESKNK